MSPKKVGDSIDPCVLESVQGTMVSIPPVQPFMHLQFRRFAGCPICNLHLQSFIRRYSELLANQIQEVVVFHSPLSTMREYQISAPFPFIADPDKKLYKAFGVKTSIMSVLNPKSWSAAVKGVFNQGLGFPSWGESALGLPADFLIDRAGKIVAVKYGAHAFDQWEVDELIYLVGSAQQGIQPDGPASGGSAD
jgi:peroxiredoxin